MYDVIIIGGGPAGISASLYTKRGNLKTLVLYETKSNLEKANEIENYYGFNNGISGKDLYEKGIEQAKNIGVTVIKEEAISIDMTDKGFKVTTIKSRYETKTVILATGSKKYKPNVKGIEEFEGKGISYCAICDGFFYRNKSVTVLGNGDYAISETNDLINITNDITILTNGQEAPNVRSDKIKIDTRKIQEISGQDKVEKIIFEDGKDIKTDGIFIAQGVAGSVDFAKKLGAITNKNTIVVNKNMETNIKGLYACGDCTGGILQVSKAVYEGTVAGLQAIKYIKNKED